MNPRVERVIPQDNYCLELYFTNKEVRLFDMKPYLEKGIFVQLKDKELFNTVRVFNGTAVWDNDLDIGPDTLFLESEVVEKV